MPLWWHKYFAHSNGSPVSDAHCFYKFLNFSHKHLKTFEEQSPNIRKIDWDLCRKTGFCSHCPPQTRFYRCSSPNKNRLFVRGNIQTNKNKWIPINAYTHFKKVLSSCAWTLRDGDTDVLFIEGHPGRTIATLHAVGRTGRVQGDVTTGPGARVRTDGILLADATRKTCK